MTPGKTEKGDVFLRTDVRETMTGLLRKTA